MPRQARQPELKKVKSNDDPRCQTLIKRGTRKPGSFTQCMRLIKENIAKNTILQKFTLDSLYIDIFLIDN